MGMSTHVLGFKPADAKFNAMKEIYLKCHELGITVPREVDDYFEGYGVEGDGVRVELEGTVCCTEYHDNYMSGFEIDITTLPKDIKTIRFYNSY